MKYLCSIFLIFVFWSCSEVRDDIIPSFYHWKTNFNLDSSQQKTLNNLKIEKLYVKYFDVKWVNNKAIPVAEVNWMTQPNFEIVPVVFIATDIFTHLDSAQIKVLSKNVASKIKQLHPTSEFAEIQIDCDWMPSIKNKYFYFLESFKSLFTTSVFSATVRLYQYKYPDLAGVPPVDKGLLMYYNMGVLSDCKESNSILNNTIGKQYVGFGEYPLPIDVALPNFNWSLVFRQGEFQFISKSFTNASFKNNQLFEHDTLNNWWVKKDTVINTNYFRHGDLIRFEYCSTANLIDAVNLLLPELNQRTTNVIIYDLNSNLKNDYEKINTVFDSFN